MAIFSDTKASTNSIGKNLGLHVNKQKGAAIIKGCTIKPLKKKKRFNGNPKTEVSSAALSFV